jgi:hypothetical protein
MEAGHARRRWHAAWNKFFSAVGVWTKPTLILSVLCTYVLKFHAISPVRFYFGALIGESVIISHITIIDHHHYNLLTHIIIEAIIPVCNHFLFEA